MVTISTPVESTPSNPDFEFEFIVRSVFANERSTHESSCFRILLMSTLRPDCCALSNFCSGRLPAFTTFLHSQLYWQHICTSFDCLDKKLSLRVARDSSSPMPNRYFVASEIIALSPHVMQKRSRARSVLVIPVMLFDNLHNLLTHSVAWSMGTDRMLH